MLDHVERFRSRPLGPEANFADAEARLGERIANIECANLGLMLAALGASDERIAVKGVSYRRLNQACAETYLALGGAIPVKRTLYREEAVRNGTACVPGSNDGACCPCAPAPTRAP
jgi:hypothetical protein